MLFIAQLSCAQLYSPPVHISSLEDTGPLSQGRQVLLTAQHADVSNEDHTAASNLEYFEQMVLGLQKCRWGSHCDCLRLIMAGT